MRLRHAADPKPGAPYLTASAAHTIEEGGQITRFRRIDFLAAPQDLGTVRNENLSTVGGTGLDSQLLGTILRPFPTNFRFLGPALYLNI